MCIRFWKFRRCIYDWSTAFWLTTQPCSMAHQLKAEERKRLTCIADQWRRTENKDNQNRVLQCMTDYTKLFFNRMGKPGTDSCNGQHKSLNTNDEDKSEDKSRADAVQVPRNQRGASRQGQTHHFENQRSKPHAFNPGISIPNGKKHDDRNGNLQSILHIGDETVKLEELIRIFDNDVARSGEGVKSYQKKSESIYTLVSSCFSGQPLRSTDLYILRFRIVRDVMHPINTANEGKRWRKLVMAFIFTCKLKILIFHQIICALICFRCWHEPPDPVRFSTRIRSYPLFSLRVSGQYYTCLIYTKTGKCR